MSALLVCSCSATARGTRAGAETSTAAASARRCCVGRPAVSRRRDARSGAGPAGAVTELACARGRSGSGLLPGRRRRRVVIVVVVVAVGRGGGVSCGLGAVRGPAHVDVRLAREVEDLASLDAPVHELVPNMSSAKKFAKSTKLLLYESSSGVSSSPRFQSGRRRFASDNVATKTACRYPA